MNLGLIPSIRANLIFCCTKASTFLKNNQKHPFHLVDPSPWPLVASIGGFSLTSGLVMYMHSYANGGSVLSLGVFIILFVMYTWWRDIIREGTLEGQHTYEVQLGLRMGMLLFIVSEIMFFFAFLEIIFLALMTFFFIILLVFFLDFLLKVLIFLGQIKKC